MVCQRSTTQPTSLFRLWMTGNSGAFDCRIRRDDSIDFRFAEHLGQALDRVV